MFGILFIYGKYIKLKVILKLYGMVPGDRDPFGQSCARTRSRGKNENGGWFAVLVLCSFFSFVLVMSLTTRFQSVFHTHFTKRSEINALRINPTRLTGSFVADLEYFASMRAKSSLLIFIQAWARSRIL